LRRSPEASRGFFLGPKKILRGPSLRKSRGDRDIGRRGKRKKTAWAGMFGRELEEIAELKETDRRRET